MGFLVVRKLHSKRKSALPELSLDRIIYRRRAYLRQAVKETAAECRLTILAP